MNNIKPHCVRLIVIAVILALTATASMAQTHRTSIRVAAADSGPSDKEMADIVCDGRHDEIPLRRALESLGGCGRLEMASGNYIIDSFFTAEDGSGYVLRTPYDSNIRIEGDLPNWNGEGVRLRVSRDCYDSLSDEVTYSVICGTAGDFAQTMSQNLEVANVAVYLPDNRKRIICIDGYNTGRMSADRCNCKGPKNNRETSITLGVMDCVGIRDSCRVAQQHAQERGHKRGEKILCP